MTMTESHLPYATMPPRQGGRVWAGAAILFAGVCLVVPGGCFLIGVLLLVSPNAFAANAGNAASTGMGAPAVSLMYVLYFLAFACFAGAAALIVVGTRRLLQTLKG